MRLLGASRESRRYLRGVGGRDGIITSRSMSGTERWGWRLLVPFLVTPGALSWLPIAAVDGEYGLAGRIAVSIYAVAVLAGAALLWHAGRGRRSRPSPEGPRSGPRHARRSCR